MHIPPAVRVWFARHPPHDAGNPAPPVHARLAPAHSSAFGSPFAQPSEVAFATHMLPASSVWFARHPPHEAGNPAPPVHTRFALAHSTAFGSFAAQPS